MSDEETRGLFVVSTELGKRLVPAGEQRTVAEEPPPGDRRRRRRRLHWLKFGRLRRGRKTNSKKSGPSSA